MTLLRNLVLIFIFLPYKLLWQYQFASHFLTALFFDTAVHFIKINLGYLSPIQGEEGAVNLILWMKENESGISGQQINWFQSYLSGYQRVALQGTYSDSLQVLSGVPQGSILGPLLFLVYIDDIPQCIKHDSKVAIFADDSKLFKIIEKPSDKFSFQQDLTQLSIWSDTWEVCLSIPKCKALNISRKKTPTKREYHLNGWHNCHQYSQHIKLISSKANRTLGLNGRVCRDINDSDIKKLLYYSIVRPQLEYACGLWSPYTSKDKLLLENVQRRATKFILNYPRDMSYRDRLLKLSLLPLEYRREMKDLVLIFNDRAGYIDLLFQMATWTLSGLRICHLHLFKTGQNSFPHCRPRSF